MSLTHTDQEYETELRRLREQILLMGAKVENMLDNAVKALVQRDSALANKMIAVDREIDALEVGTDQLCLRILAKRQPVASDLRFITIALKIVTDLERIGDLGVNICERVIELSPEPPLKPYLDIPNMADVVQGMIREALDAFVEADEVTAKRVLETDKVVDAYYAQVFRELLTYMMEDSRNIHSAIKVQSIAKYLERIGDHATNLAEMVVFMVRGQDIRHGGISPQRPHGVLFVCTHNAARSQMAEGWARRYFPSGVRVWSGGTDPAQTVDPLAVQVMAEAGVDISAHRPKLATDVPLGDVDTVVTVCDAQNCVSVCTGARREHWPVDDPLESSKATADPLETYRQVRDLLRHNVQQLVESWK